VSTVSRVRNGLIAVGVVTYLVLAAALLAADWKLWSLGSDYAAPASVLLAVPVAEGLLLVILFASGRTRRIAAAVWVIIAVDLLLVVFSSASAP
jgi:hypothetical protein